MRKIALIAVIAGSITGCEILEDVRLRVVEQGEHLLEGASVDLLDGGRLVGAASPDKILQAEVPADRRTDLRGQVWHGKVVDFFSIERS